MNQQNTEENYSDNESGTGANEENLTPEELANEASAATSQPEIENLPIESIGSYAPVEELTSDEERGAASNPTAQS